VIHIQSLENSIFSSQKPSKGIDVLQSMYSNPSVVLKILIAMSAALPVLTFISLKWCLVHLLVPFSTGGIIMAT